MFFIRDNWEINTLITTDTTDNYKQSMKIWGVTQYDFYEFATILQVATIIFLKKSNDSLKR